MTATSFGVHLLFDGYGSSEDRLADRNLIEGLLSNLPNELAMHPICNALVVQVGANNRKDPGGLSGFVMVAESHISIHTFPKRGFVSADVYTCQDDLDSDRLIEVLSRTFGVATYDASVQRRGVSYPDSDIYA